MQRRHLTLFRIASVIAVLICLDGSACLAQRNRPAPPAGISGTDAGSRQSIRAQRLRGVLTKWLGVAMKDMPRGSKTLGVQIVSVTADSPAEKAGLREGDIVTSLAGNPVANSQGFQTILFGLDVGKDYPMDVLRGDSSIALTVRPEKNPAQGVTNGTSQFEDTPAPRKGPLDINVLKYAFVDPDTRVVTFVGKYDPDYATGPIPYADILNDAIASPYPSFSIEPTDQQRAQFNQVDNMIASDIQRMNDPNYCNQWGQKLMNLILNDSSLQADNKRFYNNCGGAM
ncbi:MAG TPA: PDZ domain-containing protein, partial [Armatimonadota bacterium]